MVGPTSGHSASTGGVQVPCSATQGAAPAVAAAAAAVGICTASHTTTATSVSSGQFPPPSAGVGGAAAAAAAVAEIAVASCYGDRAQPNPSSVDLTALLFTKQQSYVRLSMEKKQKIVDQVAKVKPKTSQKLEKLKSDLEEIDAEIAKNRKNIEEDSSDDFEREMLEENIQARKEVLEQIAVEKGGDSLPVESEISSKIDIAFAALQEVPNLMTSSQIIPLSAGGKEFYVTTSPVWRNGAWDLDIQIVLLSLATGGSSTVYLAYDVGRSDMVAIKMVKSSNNASISDIEGAIAREKKFIDLLKGAEGIVETYNYFESGEKDQKTFVVIQEFCNGGDMHEQALEIPLSALRPFLVGLTSFEARGVLHRDLKPENILLIIKDNGSFELRITDFGFCVDLKDANAEKYDREAGSPPYMSPEQEKNWLDGKLDNMLDSKSDVFSAAIAFFVIYFNNGARGLPEPLRELLLAKDTLRSDLRGELKVKLEKIPEHVKPKDPTDRAVYDLLCAMLAQLPKDRPSAGEILAKFDAILAQKEAK